jgi:hypothetical protein
MSRRYGRNQKRAARARIAALEQALSRALRSYAAETTVRRRLQQVLEDVTAALGPQYIGLPPTSIPMVLHRDGFVNDRFLIPDHDGNVATMHMLSTSVQQDPIQAQRNCLHVNVKLADGRAGYAIAQSAILRTPAPLLARRIADQIAPFLLSEIRSQGGR